MDTRVQQTLLRPVTSCTSSSEQATQLLRTVEPYATAYSPPPQGQGPPALWQTPSRTTTALDKSELTCSRHQRIGTSTPEHSRTGALLTRFSTAGTAYSPAVVRAAPSASLARSTTSPTTMTSTATRS